MKASSNTVLPMAKVNYVADDEQTMRRTIEYALADLWQDVSDGHELKNKPSSLSLRRFQFLLMGASNG